MRSAFTARELVSEVGRNLISAPLRSSVSLLVAAAVGFGVIAVTTQDVGSTQAAWTAQREAGSYVLVVRPGGASAISAAACDALSVVDGVASVGAVMTVNESYAAALPTNRYAVMRVTPGFMSVAWPREKLAPFAAVTAGRVVSSDLGLKPGSVYVGRGTDGRQTSYHLEIGAATASASRFETADRSVVVATPPKGLVGECAVEAQPDSLRAVAGVLGDWFAPTPVVVAPLLRESNTARNPQAELTSRLTRWLPLVAGGALIVLFAGSWWGRRLDASIYLLLGAGRTGLLLQAIAEAVLVTILPALVGAAVALVVLAASIQGIVAGAVTRDLVKLMLVLALTPLPAVALLFSTASLDLVRGR